MNCTVKMQSSTIRALPTRFTAASVSKDEPILCAYENDTSVACWPCTAEGFLLAFAFMCKDRFRCQRADSIDVALDGLVNASPQTIVTGTAGGRWRFR